ncbi:flagellar basal body rod C-terminal domain-containing protein [Rhodovibrionaceae bacterium A322]
MSQPESFVPLRVDQVSQQGGGVRAEVQIAAQPLVQQVGGRQASQQNRQNEQEFLAEDFDVAVSEETGFAEGSLFASAVDLEGEFTTMIRAQAAYGANVQVIKTTQEMIGEALDITT